MELYNESNHNFEPKKKKKIEAKSSSYIVSVFGHALQYSSTPHPQKKIKKDPSSKYKINNKKNY